MGHIATATNDGTETFPTMFPNSCVAVVISTIENNGTSRYEAKVKSKSAENFTWYVAATGQDLDWIALGN